MNVQPLKRRYDVDFAELPRRTCWVLTGIFFMKAHVYSTTYHIHRTQYKNKEQSTIRGGIRTRNEAVFFSGIDDGGRQPPSYHCLRVPSLKKKAAELVRRPATDPLPVNGHGQRPPSPATPPCRSHQRSRSRTKPPSSSGPGFLPPDPPPPQIWWRTRVHESHAGPPAPASRRRRRQAPKKLAAGEDLLDTKPATSRANFSKAPPAGSPPYSTICTGRGRGSLTLPPPKQQTERRNPAAPPARTR